jgi:hypothetical protein
MFHDDNDNKNDQQQERQHHHKALASRISYIYIVSTGPGLLGSTIGLSTAVMYILTRNIVPLQRYDPAWSKLAIL